MKTQKWDIEVEKAQEPFSEIRPFKNIMASGNEDKAYVNFTQKLLERAPDNDDKLADSNPLGSSSTKSR